MSVENQLESVQKPFPVAGNIVGTECQKKLVLDDSKAACEIHVARDDREIERWRDFWVENNRHPDVDVDFYSLFGQLHADKFKPYILVATRNGKPKAMWIGRQENVSAPIKLGYRTLFSLSMRQIAFLQEGFLGESNPEIIEALLAHIKRELKSGLADRAYVSNTDVSLGIFKAARRTSGILFRDYSNKTAERWQTSLPANMDEFLKRRSKKHRYWLKRIGRVFDEAHPGKVKFTTCLKKEDIKSFCDAAEQIAQITYQRGLGVGFLNTPETHRRLELAMEKGWLKAYLVYVGDEPVAFWCGRLYDGIMYLEWTGYKPAYRKFEAGTVLYLKMLEDLCAAKVRAVDYGLGTAGYKERFGDSKLIEGCVSVNAPTFKGLMVNFLTTVDVVLNETAKAIVKKLGIMDRLKKRWRGKLASGEAKPAEAEGEAAGQPAKE
jgi:hypothetical protein